jgi:hypothetical protein
MPFVPEVGSQVKIYPRFASDPNPYVGRGTYVGESPEGLYMIRQSPFGQLRSFPVETHTVSPNQNANDPLANEIAGLPAPVNFSSARKRRSTRRGRKAHRRTRRNSRR